MGLPTAVKTVTVPAFARASLKVGPAVESEEGLNAMAPLAEP